MDTLSKIASDLTSWYWWVTVVIVGLAINLASAYLKSPIDAWLEGQSAKRRTARLAANEEFDRLVSKIASDPTLLVIEGQRAAHAESQIYLLFISLGVNLALLFIVSAQPEPQSSLTTTLIWLLGIVLAIQLATVIKAQRDENILGERFRAALKRYRNEA